MCEILHDSHVGKPAAEPLSAGCIALLRGTIRDRRENTGEDLIERIDDTSLEKYKGDLGTHASRGRQGAEQQSEGTGGDERRATGRKKEHVDRADEVGVHESFKVLRRGAVVGVDDSDDAKTGIFDESLVRVTKAVTDDRPNTTNHGEMLDRDVPAAI